MNSDNFLNRSFKEVIGGQYDEEGFYITPNGSFWDPDGIYFNKDGLDIHKGFYNSYLEYIPGPGWIEDLLCYEDEKDESMLGNFVIKKGRKTNDSDELCHLDDLAIEDELYEDIDYDKMLAEEEKKFNKFSKLSIEHEYIKTSSGNNNIIKEAGDVLSSNIISTKMLFSESNGENKNMGSEISSNDKVSDFKNLDKVTDLPNKSRKEKQIEIDFLFS